MMDGKAPALNLQRGQKSLGLAMALDNEDSTELLEEPAAENALLELNGRHVAFAGRLEAFNRADAAQFVRERGATPVNSASDADLLVVGMTDLPIEDLESLLSEDQARAVAEGRLTVVSESRFWQMLGVIEVDPSVRRLYTAAMLAKLLNVPLATIRRWHRRGLIVPIQMVHKLAYYDFQEVVTARQLAKLIASGASPSGIEAKLSRIAQLFPDVQRPLSQLSVIVEGKEVLLRQGEGLIEPGGQRRIDFAAFESSAKDSKPHPVTWKEDPSAESSQELVTPEQYRRLANELEDEGNILAAIQTYRSMLFAFGPNAEVNFALAELLYLQGQLEAARERYFMAIELDESFVEARGNLGCLLLELHETALAISTLEGALKLHPDYADAHFHLARALDDSGKPDAALPHWKQFVKLSPDSPFADEARERVEETER
jgi:tetratricopeptide (TPR) repeat protein